MSKGKKALVVLSGTYSIGFHEQATIGKMQKCNTASYIHFMHCHLEVRINIKKVKLLSYEAGP